MVSSDVRAWLYATLLIPATVHGKIIWTQCNNIPYIDANASGYTYDCANLSVPLDYTKTMSNESLQIQLLRVPALTQPSQGSVFVNFGGPGDPDTVSLAGSGVTGLLMTGLRYDVIAVQSRGTGTTIPFSCGSSDLDIAWLTSQNLGSWPGAEVLSEACFAANNATGSFAGTAFAARDIMAAVDALEEDGQLRYWGLSYGTVLGAAIATMFPERIDRMMLDGVVNAHEYYQLFWPQSVSDTDKVFSAMFEYCVKAGPANCTLANLNGTSQQLEGSVYQLMANLTKEPVALDKKVVLSGTSLQSVLIQSLYHPAETWSIATKLLLSLLGDAVGEETLKLYHELGGSLNYTEVVKGWLNPLRNAAFSNRGIRCSDSLHRASTIEEILPQYYEELNNSKIMAGNWDAPGIDCARWRMDAVERASSNYNIKTKNPIFMVSNSFDPVAPLASAKNMTETFEGSRLLIVDGFGHASAGNPNVCMVKHARAYFINGTLPAEGTTCEMEAVPFSGYNWTNVINAFKT